MKKKVILFIVALISINLTMAQTSDLVIFHEDGKEFSLLLNGEKQNNSPKDALKVPGLKPDVYKVEIKFKDRSLRDVKQALWLKEEGENYFFAIQKKDNGEFNLNKVKKSNLGQFNLGINTNVTNSSGEEITTTVQSGSGNSQSEQTINMNINIDGSNDNTSGSEQGTTSGSDNEEVSGEISENQQSSDNWSESDDGWNETGETTTESDGGCVYPMSTIDYNQAKSSIKSKDFEDSQLTVAKQIAKNECLTTEQVKGIMLLFDYEDTKMEFAKYAYEYVHDKSKYYKINDAFEFESSIDELNEFIESH